MASPLSITDRIAEIMTSFYTGFSSAAVRYYVGQKNQATNYTTNYIVFAPESESVIAPHVTAATFDGYDYEFCFDRNITFSAKCQAKTVENLSTMLSGLIAAIKVTNGPALNASVQWDSQAQDTGVTRQGELATLMFDLRFPVPTLKSFLVTPETFDTTCDLVDVLPDGYADGYINPRFEIPPFYTTGVKGNLT